VREITLVEQVRSRWQILSTSTLSPCFARLVFRNFALFVLWYFSKDRYKVFAAAVTESDAPDYASIVSNPMDFGRMKEKVEEGLYGTKGSMAAAALYRDFLLVFDNCRLYNTDDSEVTEEAARILALLPEAYVSSCMAAQKKVK